MELTEDGRSLESGVIIDRLAYERWRRSMMTVEERDADLRKKREYYYRNKEKMRAANARWREGNLDRLRMATKKYTRERSRTDPQFKARLYYQIKLAQGVGYIRKGYFPEHRRPFLGCTWLEFKGHITRQFEDGMTWENYGEWGIDHIVPRTEFDLLDREEVLRCFYFRNLRPRWNRDNCGGVGSVKRDRENDINPVPTEAMLLELANPGNRRVPRKKEFFASAGGFCNRVEAGGGVGMVA